MDSAPGKSGGLGHLGNMLAEDGSELGLQDFQDPCEQRVSGSGMGCPWMLAFQRSPFNKGGLACAL